MKLTTVCSRISKLALQNEKELILKVPWGNLAALTWGEPSQPPVLLCHGRLDTSSSFRPLVSHLSINRFYVSIELPGCGFSTPYPRGIRLATMDFIPSLKKLLEHYKWEKFVFIGHSLGSVVGNYYNHLHPGQITHMVELDPEPMYLSPIDDIGAWYQYCYASFYGDQEHTSLNSGNEGAPKYSLEEARERLVKARELSPEIAEHILERCVERIGDNLYRFTFDRRHRQPAMVPLFYGSLQTFYTAPSTPTYAILASRSIERGSYDKHKIAMDDTAWKNGNYKHTVIDSAHDVHLIRPKEVADLIEEFLGNP